MREHLQAGPQTAGGLRLFERRDQVGQGPVIHAPAALGRRDRQTDRQVRLVNARRPQEDDILRALDEAELGQTYLFSGVSALLIRISPLIVDDLVRLSGRRILRAPRHGTVMPDSRAQYKPIALDLRPLQILFETLVCARYGRQARGVKLQ